MAFDGEVSVEMKISCDFSMGGVGVGGPEKSRNVDLHYATSRPDVGGVAEASKFGHPLIGCCPHADYQFYPVWEQAFGQLYYCQWGKESSSGHLN